jgi:16S rRNA (guanine966-N2)-methyltransferase
MRIIAGEFKGRTIEGQAQSRLREAQSSRAKPTIRPTSDKVRGAIFNILAHGDWPMDVFGEDTRVLDCFCGSGALGLEALSRGAGNCLFLDSDATSLRLAKTNAENLKTATRAKFEMRDLAKPQTWKEAKFQLLFLDPPYKKNLAAPALQHLTEGGFVAAQAVAVVETSKMENLAPPDGWQLHTRRTWGETAACFFIYGA